ncbi:unnamed protein product [Prorocentrum cordatum]|uniref:Helicase ATP-binding domain-containing protein n=1 Tax=Prorocentrum cordatum TaxID=2364126 RepID=A0ABN9VJF6_9DINO|nr:unnamed protein product [Polarella glacialis]
MATVSSPPSAGAAEGGGGRQSVAAAVAAALRTGASLLGLQQDVQKTPLDEAGAVRLDRNLAAHAEIGKGAGVLGLPVAEKRRRQRGRRRGRKQSELSDTAGPSDEKDEHRSNLVCTDSDQGCDNPRYKYGDGDKEKIEKVVHDTFNLMDQRTSTLLSFEGKQKGLETIDNPIPNKALETDQAVQDTDVVRESQHKGVLKEYNSSAASAPLECMKNEPSLGKGGKSKPRGSYAMVNIGMGKSGFEPLGRVGKGKDKGIGPWPEWDDRPLGPVGLGRGRPLAPVDWAAAGPLEPFRRVFYQPGAGRPGPPEPLDVDPPEEQLEIRVEEDPTGDCPAPVSSFEELGALPEYALAALREHKIIRPMPIQAQALPLVLSGRDVVGIAQTGSGKTLAFLLPAVAHIEAQAPLGGREVTPIALVLAPTRELAVQISEEADKVLRRSAAGGHPGGLGAVCVYGGGDKRRQLDQLRRAAHIPAARGQRTSSRRAPFP